MSTSSWMMRGKRPNGAWVYWKAPWEDTEGHYYTSRSIEPFANLTEVAGRAQEWPDPLTLGPKARSALDFPTLQDAIDEVVALGGGIVLVPPGAYPGVVIKSSVSLVATGDRRETTIDGVTITNCTDDSLAAYYASGDPEVLVEDTALTAPPQEMTLRGIRIRREANPEGSLNEIRYPLRLLGAPGSAFLGSEPGSIEWIPLGLRVDDCDAFFYYYDDPTGNEYCLGMFACYATMLNLARSDFFGSSYLYQVGYAFSESIGRDPWQYGTSFSLYFDTTKPCASGWGTFAAKGCDFGFIELLVDASVGTGFVNNRVDTLSVNLTGSGWQSPYLDDCHVGSIVAWPGSRGGTFLGGRYFATYGDVSNWTFDPGSNGGGLRFGSNTTTPAEHGGDLQAAIDAVDAYPGGTVLLPDGDYYGPGWPPSPLTIRHDACLKGMSGKRNRVWIHAPLTITDCTDDSVAAFNLSGDPADLVQTGIRTFQVGVESVSFLKPEGIATDWVGSARGCMRLLGALGASFPLRNGGGAYGYGVIRVRDCAFGGGNEWTGYWPALLSRNVHELELEEIELYENIILRQCGSVRLQNIIDTFRGVDGHAVLDIDYNAALPVPPAGNGNVDLRNSRLYKMILRNHAQLGNDYCEFSHVSYLQLLGPSSSEQRRMRECSLDGIAMDDAGATLYMRGGWLGSAPTGPGAGGFTRDMGV